MRRVLRIITIAWEGGYLLLDVIVMRIAHMLAWSFRVVVPHVLVPRVEVPPPDD